MSYPRAALLAAAAVAAALGASAAETPDENTKFWPLRAALPSFLRTERRRLIDVDQSAVEAAISTWMEENHGARPEYVRTQNLNVWVIATGQLKDMDAMLAQYGRLRRETSTLGETEDTAAMQSAAALGDRREIYLPHIDVKAVAAHRDALSEELDAMSGRAPAIPNIARLVTSYIASLDKIAEAQKQFGSFIAVSIAFSENPTNAEDVARGPYLTSYQNAQNSIIDILPAAYRQAPGAVRIPTAWSREDDYLAWNAVDPTLDELHTLRIQVITKEPSSARKDLDTKFRSLGANPVPIRNFDAGGLNSAMVGSVLHPAMPLVGYWVSPDDLTALKAATESAGTLSAWEWHKPTLRSEYEDAAKWESSLSGELRGEEDRLSPYPHIQSLVIDQLKRLRIFAETANPSGKLELVALQVLGQPSPFNQPPKPPYAPLTLGSAPNAPAPPVTAVSPASSPP